MSSPKTVRFCRYHISKPDYDGRYPCCGALHAVNPRGAKVGVQKGSGVQNELGRMLVLSLRVGPSSEFVAQSLGLGVWGCHTISERVSSRGFNRSGDAQVALTHP